MEGISQQVSDVIEEEGIAYSIGYVAADIWGSKGIGKLVGTSKTKLLKNNKIAEDIGDAPKLAGNTGKGAYNGNVYDGTGFGKLAGKEITVSQKGIDIVKQHLSGDFSDVTNDAMIKRLEDTLLNGKKLTGGDASFYMHEVAEDIMMNKGMPYDIAHSLALEKYDASPFSVYSPEVIKTYPEMFSPGFKKFWDID